MGGSGLVCVGKWPLNFLYTTFSQIRCRPFHGFGISHALTRGFAWLHPRFLLPPASRL